MLSGFISRLRARFTVDRKRYTGTITRVVAPDEPGVNDPFAQITGLDVAGLVPDRTPAGTAAQIEEQMRYRYIVCSQCKSTGHMRTFRTAERFASHLKNYHGAKDGDAVERLG